MATYHTIIGNVVGHTKNDEYDIVILTDCPIVLFRTYDDVNNLFVLDWANRMAYQGWNTVYAVEDYVGTFRQLVLPNSNELLLKLYKTPQQHSAYGTYVGWQPLVPIVTWADTLNSLSGSFSSHSIINPNPSP